MQKLERPQHKPSSLSRKLNSQKLNYVRRRERSRLSDQRSWALPRQRVLKLVNFTNQSVSKKRQRKSCKNWSRWLQSNRNRLLSLNVKKRSKRLPWSESLTWRLQKLWQRVRLSRPTKSNCCYFKPRKLRRKLWKKYSAKTRPNWKRLRRKNSVILKNWRKNWRLKRLNPNGRGNWMKNAVLSKSKRGKRHWKPTSVSAKYSSRKRKSSSKNKKRSLRERKKLCESSKLMKNVKNLRKKKSKRKLNRMKNWKKKKRIAGSKQPKRRYMTLARLLVATRAVRCRAQARTRTQAQVNTQRMPRRRRKKSHRQLPTHRPSRWIDRHGKRPNQSCRT